MRSLLLSVLCLLSVARAQAPQEFVGRLDPELVPDELRYGISVRLTLANADVTTKLGSLVTATDKVFVGELPFGDPRLSVYLVESSADSRAVIADLNGNGTYEPGERVPLTPAPKADEPVIVAATVRLATPKGSFSTYPIRVGLTKGMLSLQPPKAGSPEVRSLRATDRSYAIGTASIDGKPVKVQIIPSPKDFAVNPARGYQYVDANLDGEIDWGETSWEMGYAEGAPVVFHVGDGDRYVSIKRVDAAAGTITLAARSAAEYERIELRVGSTPPDFPFTSLDGAPRRLSDFRGKHLLIDFWGTWCGPCVGEMPQLKKVYETYRDKGFEILGMDFEQPDVTPEDFAKGLEKVKAFVKERGITWMQAQTESIKPLYERRFQIVAYPTHILLDPQGRILSVGRKSQGEPGLFGDDLDKTLAAIFKNTPGAGKAPLRPLRPVHTFSIVARDPVTGEMGAAVQSHWFAVGSNVIWAEAGVGAVATQSFIDPSYGPLGLASLRAGRSAPEALRGLLAADPNRNVRQVGMVDAQGRVAAYTGTRDIQAAGDIVGAAGKGEQLALKPSTDPEDGWIHAGRDFAVQANLMANDKVWPAMARAFQEARGDLADRMLAALDAAQAVGGDIRGRQSAAIIVVKAKPSGRPWEDRLFDLRVDDADEPIRELGRLVALQRAYNHMNAGDAAVERRDNEGALREYSAAEAIAAKVEGVPASRLAEMMYWHAVALATMGRVDESLPIFRKAFALQPSWRELTPRLPRSGLLPDDPALIARIVAQGK